MAEGATGGQRLRRYGPAAAVFLIAPLTLVCCYLVAEDTDILPTFLFQALKEWQGIALSIPALLLAPPVVAVGIAFPSLRRGVSSIAARYPLAVSLLGMAAAVGGALLIRWIVAVEDGLGLSGLDEAWFFPMVALLLVLSVAVFSLGFVFLNVLPPVLAWTSARNGRRKLGATIAAIWLGMYGYAAWHRSEVVSAVSSFEGKETLGTPSREGLPLVLGTPCTISCALSLYKGTFPGTVYVPMKQVQHDAPEGNSYRLTLVEDDGHCSENPAPIYIRAPDGKCFLSEEVETPADALYVFEERIWNEPKGIAGRPLPDRPAGARFTRVFHVAEQVDGKRRVIARLIWAEFSVPYLPIVPFPFPDDVFLIPVADSLFLNETVTAAKRSDIIGEVLAIRTPNEKGTE